VTPRDLERAHLANALFDAHRDDPEFGHRLLGDEARAAGHVACDRTVWRICRDNSWWSVFGKKRGRNGKRPGPPAHDDLVRRDFTASRPNELWLTDITEHPTSEGKLYLCAIKDV
jgi:transposase InsO family protein